jgi:transcription termination factor NusB
MKNDFRHFCLVSLFSVDEIATVKLIDNDLSNNQVLRAEQLLKNTKDNIDTIFNVLEKNTLNWTVERIGKAEKTTLILGISEIMLNLTPSKVIVAEWTKLTDKHASSDGAKFVNAILDNISKNHDFT